MLRDDDLHNRRLPSSSQPEARLGTNGRHCPFCLSKMIAVELSLLLSGMICESGRERSCSESEPQAEQPTPGLPSVDTWLFNRWSIKTALTKEGSIWILLLSEAPSCHSSSMVWSTSWDAEDPVRRFEPCLAKFKLGKQRQQQSRSDLTTVTVPYLLACPRNTYASRG